ncbi:MAG TPA: ATP synthase F0 subunit B [Planctomycetaceae bacterium]|nr:ATP synthase F0 subunit B [Planctomycetaceae bacterium]
MFKQLCFALFALSAMLVLPAASFAQDESAGDGDTAEVTSDADVGEEDAEDDGHSDGEHGDEDHSGEGHGDEHGEGHGSHDNDPTHANLSDDGLNLMGWRTDLALFNAVVFLILLMGLMAFAWKPIIEGLEKREKRIAGNIQQAEEDAAAAKAKLAEYEQKLASASEEAQEIVATARKDAEAAGQKIVAAAQEDAARLQERAESEIESAKKVALSELAGQSTAIAMSVAGRVVGREVNADDHNGLIQEMLSKLPSEN